MNRCLALCFFITAACSTASTTQPPPTTTTTATTTTSTSTTTTTVPATVPPKPAVVEAPRARSRSAAATELGAGSVEQAICAAWGDGCAKAIAVARCESNLNPRAVNGPHRGLLQINVRIHARRIANMGYTADSMFEVGPNIAVARALFVEQGWRPWSCA